MKLIKIQNTFILLILLIIIINISIVTANDYNNTNLTSTDFNNKLTVNTTDLNEIIKNTTENQNVILEPGKYTGNKILIDKNITIQGNGNPKDIIIDGEQKIGGIFLIRNPNVHIFFKNITIINGLTNNFGGAISIETGNVYVDNCIFINNTALSKTNAGAISNYGNMDFKSYLFINNTLFLNNHATHDGGAVTTCYASSDIYNCVFINNSANRDGGAIRVSVAGYGNVEDCIFIYNHADEWGGAYYSWSGESNIKRCIFLNNTAGTNGGAVMVSGNINLEQSIIVNNNGGETGGSFYIQQPMYDKTTVINVHDNLITNNTSPYGKEIFIKWSDSYHLFTKFNDNDWGSENPNDSSVIDPDNITSRSKVSTTIKSNLFNELNLNLIDKYNDLLNDYFPNNSLDTFKKQFKNNTTTRLENENNEHEKTAYVSNNTKNIFNPPTNYKTNLNITDSKELNNENTKKQEIIGNSTSHGNNEKTYELKETKSSTSKKIKTENKTILIIIASVLILLLIGYIRNKKVNS